MGSNGLEPLIAKAWLTTALGAVPLLAGAGIHDAALPQDAPVPGIVFRVLVQPHAVQGHRGVTLVAWMRYLVEAITVGQSFAPLIPYAAAIHTALDGARYVDTAYGRLRSCTYEEAYEQASYEPQTSQHYRRLGGIYRLEVQA